MSVNITSENNVITISHLGWSIPLHFESGKNHFGIPTHPSTFEMKNGFYKYQYNKSFCIPHSINKPDCLEVDVGSMNKDTTTVDHYYTISVTKNGYSILYH